MSEPLLKARDVAQLLGLEMGTVLDHFEAGDIPGFRLYGRKGGPVRFRRTEILDWLERYCRHGQTDGPALREQPGPDTREGASDARPTLRKIDA